MQSWWTHWEQHLLHWIKIWPWVWLPSVSAPPFVFILSLFLHLTRCLSVRRYLVKLLLEAGSGFGRQWETLGGADLLGSSGFYLCDLPGPQGRVERVVKVYGLKIQASVSRKENNGQKMVNFWGIPKDIDHQPKNRWLSFMYLKKRNVCAQDQPLKKLSNIWWNQDQICCCLIVMWVILLKGDEVEWKLVWLDIGKFYHLWYISCTVGPGVKINLVFWESLLRWMAGHLLW